MEKIDFIVTWVDGNDPQWRKERQKYMPQEKNSANAENRFRDWDLMRYWFRGVEKFAPWVNNVFFVTCGHYPEWLDLKHPKLKHIKHEDYIPKEYLPTYNSNVIEMHFHKIPELSEHFVLFNDDIFITNNVQESDFFAKGIPCESALLGQISASSPDDIFSHTVLNNSAVINKYFSKKEVLREHAGKFFSLKYGKDLARNILLFPAKYFSCFFDSHVTSSYLKSSFQKVWDKEPEFLKKACSARFSTTDDVSHWLIKSWQICEGRFVPRSSGWGRAFSIGEDPEMIPAIRKQRYKAVCVNDCNPNLDYEVYQKELKIAFESVLPEKSSFEK